MMLEVKSKRDLADFIYLPLRLHRRNSKWIPPVYIDEWKFFNPDENKVPLCSYLNYNESIIKTS